MSSNRFANLRENPACQRARGAMRARTQAGVAMAAMCFAGMAMRGAAAVTIVWDGEVGARALASDGVTGWGSQYVIDLGVFGNGFTPTTSNLGDWGANWLSLGTTNYNPAPGGDAGSANFAGSVVLSDNSLFEAGAQVYMWVRDGMAISEYGQWLLVTDDAASVGDDWLIPDTTGSDQTTPAVTWSLFCDATEQTVVFGGVESGGTGGEWWGVGGACDGVVLPDAFCA